MPAKNADRHDSAPDTAVAALRLIDVINDLEFEGGERLLDRALPMAERIAALKRRAKRAGIPVIYANHNYGRWQSDFTKLIEHTLSVAVRGQPVAERPRPEDGDYFVLKPRHSACFSTTLDTLLAHLGVRTLVLTGMAANYAYMRDFHLVAPAACIASNKAEDNVYALRQVAEVLKAETTLSGELDLARLNRKVVG